VVIFDSRDPGTPASAWDASGIRSAPTFDLRAFSSVVVVSAHPDDETLGAGGLIAQAAAIGLPVRVIVVTDGGADGAAGTAARRSRELRDALAQLGESIEIVELGFRDGGTLDDRDALGAALGRELRDEDPRTLLVAPWEGDGHRDHRVVGELVREHAGGRTLAAYPIWAWHWGEPGEPPFPAELLRSVAVDPTRKHRAIARHASQVDGPEPMLHAGVVEHFVRDPEVFVVIDAAQGGLERDYFENIYQRRDDPWGYLDRWYEQRKRDATLAALPSERYEHALEVGCSIGVLTELLAERCGDLLAIDVSAVAVERARARLGDRARIEQLDARAKLPEGPFDLVVLSEVGYYFGDALDTVLAAARAALSPTGDLVACHWRHPVDDYPLSGDEVHDRIAGLGLARLVRHEEDDFLLEVWSADGRSVGSREGLA
jgi:LmbE family N-acetylglucosaminyl deacetylase/SAM-dependent methyltransferase